MNARKLFVRAMLTCGIVVVLVGIVWLVTDRSAVEKLVTAAVMPAGLIWILLSVLTAWIVFFRGRGSFGVSGDPGLSAAGDSNGRQTSADCRFPFLLRFLCMLTWSAYTVIGNGFVSTMLASSLESRFEKIVPLKQPPFDVIVLLGGGARVGRNGRHQGNQSGDRLILAAQMYHCGLTQRIICTGQRIKSMDSSGFDPAEQSRDVLLNLGVPEQAVEMLGGRTTSEEMRALGKRFQNSDTRVGLITSAWHLPRALRLAHANGFQPEPLPADFLTGPVRPLTTGEFLNACIPQGGAFMVAGQVAKEYLGMLVGR